MSNDQTLTKRDDKRIYALFEFTPTGRVRSIYLNAENDRDQITLEKALDRLLKPQFSWMKKLFCDGR